MERKIRLNTRDREALSQVKQFLESGPQQRFSLVILCKKAGLNRDKLKKGFRLLFGMPPFRYYREHRMHEAKRLLLETEQPINEIAYSLGFEQGGNFSTAFKKFYGFTPLAMRSKKE